MVGGFLFLFNSSLLSASGWLLIKVNMVNSEQFCGLLSLPCHTCLLIRIYLTSKRQPSSLCEAWKGIIRYLCPGWHP